MPTLLSLFDYSGNWSRPYAERGWNVIYWDVKHETDYYGKFSNILDACADYIYDHIFDNYGTVDGVLAALPCTEFASSGAQYWPAKDEDGRTEFAVELAYQVLRIVDLCKPYFWSLENPVGRLPKLVPEIGKPFYFQPFDYAGFSTTKEQLYLIKELRHKSQSDFTDKDIQLIRDCGVYTKKQGCGGALIFLSKTNWNQLKLQGRARGLKN